MSAGTSLLSRVEDNLRYWLTVAVSIFIIWRAGQVGDDRSSMFLLFAAAYLLIHAHGQRILDAVKKRDEVTL